MNILLVNHYAGHPLLGMEYRPFFMAKEWQKKGHDVHIVASSVAHVRQVQPEVNHWHQDQILDGVQYTWLSSTEYKGNGAKRFINIFIFLFRLFFYGFFVLKKKPDVIIASSTYPLDIYICRLLAKKYKARLIFEVHDLWPLSPMELGGYSEKHPFIRLLQHAENYAYKYSDQIVSILPCTLEHMQEHGLKKDKFHHIPNGIFPDQWNTKADLPKAHKDLIDSLKAEGKFLIAYTGAHGTANDLDSLIESALHLDEAAQILLIGKGPEKLKLKAKAEELNLTNVHFLEAIPKTLIPAILNQMDALYIGLARQPLFRFGVSPNKLMDYMMAAKPIIYAIDSGNHPVVDANCGVETEPGQPKKIAESINDIVKKPYEKRKELGENGKDYVCKKHSYYNLADEFLSVLKMKN